MTEIDVDAPYPRNDTFRTSAAYNDFCRVTSVELKRAMPAAEEE